MKSARERAEEALYVAHDRDRSKYEIRRALEKMFKEHARDQRQRCGSALLSHPVHTLRRNAARNVVLNAPAPGEEP